MCFAAVVCVCLVARSTTLSQGHSKSQLAAADDASTSQSGAKTSAAAGVKSTDHNTAFFSARTAGNYRRSKRKSIMFVFTSSLK